MPPSLFHRVYDDLYADKDYAGEVDQVFKLAELDPEGAKVLEIGPGTGNHSLEAARRGCHVTAVEIDPDMVEIMQAKLAQQPEEIRRRITLIHAPLESLDPAPHDLALALFNVVNYVPDLASLHSLFAAVAAHLPSGRSFIFDAWNGIAAILDPPMEKTARVETDTHAIRFHLTPRTDLMRLETELSYRIELQPEDGRAAETETGSFHHTLWPPSIYTQTLETAGLDPVSLSARDDIDRPATADDWKLLIHARRR